jgi:hypothetical protein
MRRNKSEALLEDLSELPGAVFETDKDSDRLLSVQSPNSLSSSNPSRQAGPQGSVRLDEEEESDSSPSFTLEQVRKRFHELMVAFVIGLCLHGRRVKYLSFCFF